MRFRTKDEDRTKNVTSKRPGRGGEERWRGVGVVGKRRVFVQSQSSARQNGLPFSPRHSTIRVALVKATKNKTWRTETIVLPEQKVAITEQSQDCQANSKVIIK